MRQLSTSLPLPTALPTTLPTALPTTLPTMLPTKLPAGLSAASSAKATLAPSAESNQSAAANKQNGNKKSTNTQHEMQRLKGLGLTVSVGQVSKPPVATVAADKAKPQTKVDLSKSLALGQKPGAKEQGARPLPSSQTKSESMASAVVVKPTSSTASSYSPAQKLQLKSQVGK